MGLRRKSITVKEDVAFEMELMWRLGARGGAPGQEHVMPLHDAFVDEKQQQNLLAFFQGDGDIDCWKSVQTLARAGMIATDGMISSHLVPNHPTQVG